MLPSGTNSAQKNEVFHQGFLQYMWPNPEDTTDLVTFTEEIFNAKVVCFIDKVLLNKVILFGKLFGRLAL